MRTEVVAQCRASSRRVTFSLPEDALAGGFGDRLLGLVTTQYVSLMTSSALHVNWTRPYDLRQYFHVHDCTDVQRGTRPHQMLVQQRKQSRERGSSKVIPAVDDWTYFIDGSFAIDSKTDITIMTNGRHWLDVVNAPISETRARALRLNALNRQQLFRVGVDALLSPRQIVIDAARVVQERLTARLNKAFPLATQPWYVGVQIRCGAHGSLTWTDPDRHNLEDIPCFVDETVRACTGRSVCPIFLTSDSDTASKAFRAALLSSGPSKAIVVEAEGPILHTDRTDATAAAATGAPDPWLRSIVDWWLLKHASKLVISRSGFGETAAWASATRAPARRVELGRPGACIIKNFETTSLF